MLLLTINTDIFLYKQYASCPGHPARCDLYYLYPISVTKTAQYVPFFFSLVRRYSQWLPYHVI